MEYKHVSKEWEERDGEQRKARKMGTKANGLIVRMRRYRDPTHLKESIYEYREQLKEVQSKEDAGIGKRLRWNDRSKKKKMPMQWKINEGNKTLMEMKKTFEMQKVIRKQEEELTELESSSSQLKASYEEELARVRSSWQIEKEEMTRRKNEEREAVAREEAALRAKVEYLKKFPQRELEYGGLIAKLEAQLISIGKSNAKDIDNIKQEHRKVREVEAEVARSEIQQIKSQEVAKLQAKMTREQIVSKENQLIEEQIRLCQQEHKQLAQECESLGLEIEADKLRDPQNQLGNEATQTYERSLRVIKLEGKLTQMKAYLQEETTRLEAHLAYLQKEHEKALKEWQTKLARQEVNIKIRQRDLKKLKACCQMVLDQRTSLQAYLLEVFHEHPELNPKLPHNINPILRHLFVKINSAAKPLSYKDFLRPNSSSQSSQSQY